MSNYTELFKEKLSEAQDRIAYKRTLQKRSMALQREVLALANIRALLPELLAERSPDDMIKELLYGRSQAPLEPYFVEKIKDYKCQGSFIDVVRAPEQPRIFCTYHLGSYRAIICLLTRLGCDFSLVIDRNVIENQGERIRQMVGKISQYFQTEVDFDLINAEDFNAAMRMVRTLSAGKSLVVYLDGNTGTGGVYRHDERLIKVKFFDTILFARKGISYISYITKVPIQPVIAYRERDIDVVLQFFDAIDPAQSQEGKHTFCLEVTQQLYRHLEQKLRQYPLQWEAWLYVHKYFDLEYLSQQLAQRSLPMVTVKQDQSQELVFNEDQYSLFQLGGDYFLFDNNSYQSHLIEESLFRLLQSFHPVFSQYQESPLHTPDPEILAQLLDNQILVYQ